MNHTANNPIDLTGSFKSSGCHLKSLPVTGGGKQINLLISRQIPLECGDIATFLSRNENGNLNKHWEVKSIIERRPSNVDFKNAMDWVQITAMQIN